MIFLILLQAAGGLLVIGLALIMLYVLFRFAHFALIGALTGGDK